MTQNRIASPRRMARRAQGPSQDEKALTRLRDLVAAERRALPWVKVEKNHVFDTSEGKKTLAELFGNNSQLIIHHYECGLIAASSAGGSSRSRRLMRSRRGIIRTK